MRLRNSALAAAWAISAVGCAQQDENPFADRARMVPPPETAALVFTSGLWSTTAGAGREAYAVNADGSGLTRLTFCNTDFSACDNLEVAPSADRKRIISRRSSSIDPSETITYVDLARGVESTLVPSSRKVSSIEWAPFSDSIFYSGVGVGGQDDIYRIDYNGQNDLNVTASAGVTERDPRTDLFFSQLAMSTADATGPALIDMRTSLGGGLATTGGAPGEPLTGLPWIVGSDADPAFSPEADALVFRRCTGLGLDGQGHWDILTISDVLGPQTVVASGPVYRSEPDWGPEGIAFFERDLAGGFTRLVLVDPTGGSRRVLVEQPASIAMGPPRFLARP